MILLLATLAYAEGARCVATWRGPVPGCPIAGDVVASATRGSETTAERAARRQQLLKDVETENRGGKSKIRRRQLLVAAAQAFHRHGYKGATLKGIAEAGGILPCSIYHYFHSKEDLYVQVHDEGFKDLNAAVTGALAHVRDPRARLEAACAAHLALLVGGDALAGFTGNTLVFTPNMDMLNKRLIKVRDAYEARIRALVDALDLSAGIDRTQFRLALLGALNWTQVWYRPGKKTPSQIAHDLVEIFCR